MTSLRWLVLLAAAVIVPSCGREHHHGDWLWVTVRNEGVESANVWAEGKYTELTGVWSEHVDAAVSPNESVRVGLRFEAMTELKVMVHRSSDAFLLFYETWNRHDLEHLNENVEITVSP